MAAQQQSLQNHARIVPAFHYFVFGALAVNLGFAIRTVIVAPSWTAGVQALTAAALVVLAWYTRVFALTVQDRVIRLEMRIRLREALPADLQPRIHDFTRGQLVAMRFASDEELADLAGKVLRDNVQDRKAIKQMIRTWNADHLRA